MWVFVDLLTGLKLAIVCEPHTTIDGLKELIANYENIHPHKQLIRFKGKPLQDNDTLAHVGITDQSTVNLTLCLQGGGGQFVNVLDHHAVQKLEFSNTAPTWHVVSGLNDEAVCHNSQCLANTEKVICPVGMVSWYQLHKIFIYIYIYIYIYFRCLIF